MDTIRAFVALELPTEVKQALAEAQEKIRKANPAAGHVVKWVDPASIHLTLKFLGETPTAKLDAIVEAMTQAAMRVRPLSLRLGSCGCFPNARRPRVLWVGVAGDVASLGLLQTALEQTISPLGFPTEGRPFSPHLTLGRVRDEASAGERAHLGDLVQATMVATSPFTITHCSLMRSDLRPTGAVYTRLASAVLGSTIPPSSTSEGDSSAFPST